jgi:hypothetical protein
VLIQTPTPTTTLSPTVVSIVQTPTVTFQPTSTITTTVLVNTPVLTAPPPGVTATLAGLRVASLDQSVIGPSPTVNAGLAGTFLQPNLFSIAPMQTCSATGCQTTAVPDARQQMVTQLGGLMSSTPGFQGPGYIMSQAPVVPPGGPPSGVPGASAQGNAGGQGGQGGPGSQGNAPVQLADLGAGGGGITGRGAGGGQSASAAALDGMAESTGQGGGGPSGASGGARAVLVNFASQRADEGLAGEVAIANALANIAPAAGGAAPAARQRRFAVDLNGDGLIQFHVSEHTLTAMQRSATPGARVLDDVVNVGPQANAAVKVENGEIVIQ